MTATTTVPEIFDRNARRRRRDRTSGAPEAFLTGLMIDELLDRLTVVTRQFADVLIIGAEARLIATLSASGANVTMVDPSPLRAGACACDEDRLAFASGIFDLVIACGTLATVADLPGALILIRRALRPDGLMLACFAGAVSFASLRRAAALADAENGRSVARFHPQVDVRAAGDLLVRAGFALPVADLDNVDLAYRDVAALLRDLRAAAMTNVLAERHAVSRNWLARLAAAFVAQAGDDGRVHETLALLTLTGWAPAPDQPKPAARGSATASLSAALRPKH